MYEQKLRESRPYGAAVCSFGYEAADGYLRFDKSAPCLAQMQGWAPQKFKSIGHTLWYQDLNKAISKAFIEYLFDKDESPWRSLLTDIEVKLYGDEGELPFGFSLHGDIGEKSTQFLANLLIASRLPYEHSSFVKSWYNIHKMGVTRTQALFLATQIKTERGIGRYGGGGWHHPFESTAQYVSYTSLRDSKPAFSKVVIMSKSTLYRPCSCIWYKDGDKSFFHTLESDAPKEIPSIFKYARSILTIQSGINIDSKYLNQAIIAVKDLDRVS